VNHSKQCSKCVTNLHDTSSSFSLSSCFLSCSGVLFSLDGAFGLRFRFRFWPRLRPVSSDTQNHTRARPSQQQQQQQGGGGARGAQGADGEQGHAKCRAQGGNIRTWSPKEKEKDDETHTNTHKSATGNTGEGAEGDEGHRREAQRAREAQGKVRTCGGGCWLGWWVGSHANLLVIVFADKAEIGQFPTIIR
jgi:hypothetical protein